MRLGHAFAPRNRHGVEVFHVHALTEGEPSARLCATLRQQYGPRAVSVVPVGPAALGLASRQATAQRDGLSVEEIKVRALGALWGLAATNQRWTEAQETTRQPVRADYHVLGRAARAALPGVVFARAAERGEVEPLTSLFSRLFAGLPA